MSQINILYKLLIEFYSINTEPVFHVYLYSHKILGLLMIFIFVIIMYTNLGRRGISWKLWARVSLV